MAQKTVYEFTPEVAFQFYNLKYPQEETRSTMKASMPGLDVTEEESEAAGAVGNNIAQATQQQAAGGAAAPPEAAAEIARRLIHMGERINETLDQDFHERFKAELSHYSLFSLGYEQFRHVCISSLARVQSMVRNGWQQAYLLTSGWAYASRQAALQARDAANDRMECLANYLRDVLRETSLEDWLNDHGGWDNVGSELTDDDRVVQIDVPPEGTAV